MPLNILTGVVVACLFVMQTAQGKSARSFTTVASRPKLTNISHTLKRTSSQIENLFNVRRAHSGADLQIAKLEKVKGFGNISSNVYTRNRENNSNQENIRLSNVSRSGYAATSRMISDERHGHPTQQPSHKSKRKLVQDSRVKEYILEDKSDNTARVLDNNYKEDTDKTTVDMKVGSTPEPVPTLQLNPAQVYQDANARLKNFILNQHNIVHRLAPYNIKQNSLANTSGILLKFTPIRILFLDEVQQSITVSSFMMVRWYDNSFTWDPLQFGNITETFIKSTKLWTPTIILPTSTGHGLYLDTTDDLQVSPKQDPARAVLSMKFPFQFTVQCEFDMSKYPFDQQTCVIIFRELNQNPLSALTSKETDFEMAKSLHTSGEWEIVHWYHLERSAEEPFTLRWRIRLRRQSQFYVANLLIPLVQTSLMTLLVFWIPAESGEKMSFVVSMFVSTSVFLFTINDEMPRSIRQLPTINILVVVVTSEIIMVAMASLFVLRRCRYLQTIKSANTSLKSAPELGRGRRSAEADCREVSTNLSIHEIAKHLSHTESTPEYLKSIFEALTSPNTGSSNKAFAARIGMSDSSTKTTFKFNMSETEKNQFKIWSDELYSHETLDLIFFCVFVFINVIVGIVTYFSWF